MEKANTLRLKKYGRWRAAALLSVYILMGIHITHWIIAGQTLAPLELNEVLYTLHLGVITAGFIFMGVVMLGTLIFGRLFCSWACHILALQDLSEWILSKLRIKPVHIRSRIFFLIPVISMLYLFVWPQVYRIATGGEFAGFHIIRDPEGWASFVTKDFWRNLPSIPVTLFTFFSCGFLIILLLGTRSFCQDVCPYGVLFALGDKIAPGKIKLTGDCTQCGICTAHCSSHIVVHKEIEQFGKVVNSNCLKDLDCVAVCPNDAIKYGFTRPSLMDSFRTVKGAPSKFHFSLTEDIGMGLLTLFAVFVFRGLYDTVPFLLAITLAVLFAYIGIVFARLFYRSYVHWGKWDLKLDGRISGPGRLIIPLFILVIALTFHSAYVHYHQFLGDTAYQASLNAGDKDPLLKKALYHLEKAERWGILSPYSQNRQLASIYLGKREDAKAERYLKKMIEQEPGDSEARLRLAKIRFLLGDEGSAIHELKTILELRTDKRASVSKVTIKDALLMLGHIEEKNGFPSSALIYYKEAYQLLPEDPETLLALGVLYTRSGDLQKGEQLLLSCSRFMKDSPVLHNNLGAIYLKTGRTKEAIHQLERLVALQPGDFLAHYNLGMLYFREGQTLDAVMQVQHALQLNPEHENSHLGAAAILDSMGKKEDAMKHREFVKTLRNEKK